jgi:two-component sensor histidine kinase
MLLSISKVVEERYTPEELAKVHEQLWQCVLQFGNLSAMQERNRIARDLHDSLGHALTALNIQLQTAVKLWQLNPEKAQRFLAEAVRLGGVATNEVRQSVKLLRDNAPEKENLENLIESLVADFHSSTGILPSTEINLPSALPQEVITPVYRIVQEAVNNICKYACATQVKIQLIANANTLVFSIKDNGRGFNLESARFGFGIQGMRERVDILRGQFSLYSAPGEGCEIRAEIPLQSLPKIEQESQSGLLQTTVQAEDQPKRNLLLTPEQVRYLEEALLELSGPVAPKLVQQLIIGASSFESLIEALAHYLPGEEQLKFKQQVAIALKETTQPKSQPDTSVSNNQKSQPNKDMSKQDFAQLCERELSDLVGPIAPLLVQKTLLAFPQISNEELVKTLTAQIPDAQDALKFQNRLLT